MLCIKNCKFGKLYLHFHFLSHSARKIRVSYKKTIFQYFMFTSHVVTQTIKKTYTEGLRFKTNNFYYFRKNILKDLEIFFYCEQEEVKNPTSTSLVSWSWFILKHQDVCPLLLSHHQSKYQFVRKTNNALMLLWKYVCSYGHPGRVSGIPRGPQTTLKTMALPDSLAFFF